MKCSRCKLPNDVNAEFCTRCYFPFSNKVENEMPTAIYRDRNMLVVSQHTSLPKRCYKCNSRKVVAIRSQELEYTPTIGKLIKFAVGQIVPIPLPVPTGSKTVELDLSFCKSHDSRRPMIIKIGFGSIILSVICLILGLALADNSMAFIVLAITSVAVFCIGLLILYAGAEYKEYVTMGSHRDHYFWINGFGEEYLSAFPALTRKSHQR